MIKNRKTATVTWIKYYNYGTYLQAYALQQTILRLGFENAILDDSLIEEEGRKKKYTFIRKGISFAKSTIKRLFFLEDKQIRQFRKNQKNAIAQYDSFKKEFLTIDYNTIPLADLDTQYEQFICGSDQIWAPSPHIFSPYYYLDFTQKKKIAYAPSIGLTDYPDEFIPKTKTLIQSFDYLSIREKQGCELLEKRMGLKAKLVIDPTLLLDMNDWNKLFNTNKTDNKNPYILCYFLSNNSWYQQFVEKLSKKEHLPVKIIAIKPEQLHYGQMITGGPLEFLEQIKNATYIITDSYHGTIFSLIFEKKFYALKRFSVDSDNNQNSRIENLFAIIEKEDYFIGEGEMEKIDILMPLDYVKIKTILSKQREDSITYLSNALNA